MAYYANIILSLVLAHTAAHEYKYGEEVIYHSDTPAEDCYLCGRGIESMVPWCWGQENVAFISLNTFEIKPLEINRYDRLDGHLFAEPMGAVSFGGGGSQDGGFSANLFLEYDRGYATGSLDFPGDKDLNLEKVSSFPCADCMNEILPQRIEKCFGVGDFHIERYPQTQSTDLSRVHLIIFYCPVRYEDGT